MHNDEIIINEASSSKIIRNKKKGKTKYTCPYCTFRGTKYENVVHIERDHPELIPQGYTAARVFFNHIHHKDNGSCIICKQPTKWNEETWRYDRLCTNSRCKEKYQNSMKKGMVDKYGKTTLLKDPKHQNKMLASRRISGEYRFKDGGIRTYVGKYERNLLEYFDKIMHAKSKDILTPGPNIKYEFKGKKLLWITDMYYIPANLIIEVKDGGDNPNKREMPVYRAKQVAKEKALAQSGKYNYIRLTDNNFIEFAKTLDEIKDLMEDDSRKDEIVFNVLEAGLAGVNPTIGMGTSAEYGTKSKKLYMVSNIMNDTIVNTGFTTDDDLKDINYKDEETGKLISKSITDLDCDYVVRYSEDDELLENYNKLMENWKMCMMNGKGEFKVRLFDTNGFDPDFMYEYITNETVMIPNQPLYNENFKPLVDKMKKELYIVENELYKGFNNYINEAIMIEEYNYEYPYVKELLEGYDELDIYSHPYGYILYNEITRESSHIFNRLEDIKYRDLDRISGGILNEKIYRTTGR